MDFLEFLVKQKYLNSKQAKEVKEEAAKLNRSIGSFLVEKRLLGEEDLFSLKSQFLQIPLRKIIVEEIPPDVFSLIPRSSVEFYKVVPLSLKREEAILEVGMVNPEDSQAREALKFLARQSNLTLRYFLVNYSDFKRYLNQYKAPEKEVEKALQRLEEEISDKGAEKGAVEPAAFNRLVEEAPIIKMVAVILRQAVEGKASDIHIEPTVDDLRIRFRLDGILYPSLILPLKVHPAIVARVKILSRLKIDETRIPQDGRFSTRIDAKRVDFRVSTFPTTLGEKVVIRVLDPSSGLRSLEALGFSQRDLKVVHEAIKKPHGMVLVTGPTGSGKTTTLYTILGLLNNEGVNIVTLEDPVEYFISGVNQSQVNPDIEYTFARGLRQILRQDPNIIMVGEIRDEETANLAVNAALTGHLVLSTLHTTSALGVIPRLLDIGVKSFLLVPTLSVAVSQRLVRILCTHCREKVRPDEKTKKYILEKLKNIPAEAKEGLKLTEEEISIFKAKGCKECNSRGYSGRCGVFEVLEMTETLGEIIVQSLSSRALWQEARNQGMTTMEEDGIIKALKGITTLEEVLRVAEEK